MVVGPVAGSGTQYNDHLADSSTESIDGPSPQTTDSDTTESLSSNEPTTTNNLEDEQDFEDDYTVNRTLSSLSISSPSGEDFEINDISTDEQETLHEVRFQIEGNSATDIPFMYPVVVDVTVEDSSGSERFNEAIPVQLVPSSNDDEHYTVDGRATFTVNQESTNTYDVTVSGTPTYQNSAAAEVSDSVTISGEYSGAESSGSIEEITTQRELPSIESVDSFRASDEASSFGESSSLPISDRFDGSAEGVVEGFSNMTENDANAARFRTENSRMNITTKTGFIENGDPQTLLIRYRTGSDDDIFINPIDGNGSVVDSDTQYNLNDLDSCVEGDVTNLCAIELSEDEMNYVNDRGELFLSYTTSSTTELEVVCQDVVSSYIDRTGTACGLSEEEEVSSPTSSSGLITQFGLVEEGEFNTDDEIQISPSDISDSNVGIEVINTGSEPIDGDTPVVITDSLSEGSVSEESTSSTSFNSTPDMESVTLNLSNTYPTQALELEFSGEVNQGYVGVLVETNQGQKYTQISNFSESEVVDFSGISGTAGSATVTMNAVYSSSVSEDNQPQIDEVTLNAQDIQEGEIDPVTVGTMSGGSDSLGPSETRTHELELDLETELENALQITYFADFLEDNDEFTIKSESGLVADAGGPYTVGVEELGGELESDIVEGSTERQTLTTTPYSELGFTWEQADPTPVDTGVTTDDWTTSYSSVPAVDLSDDEIVDYLIENNYIQEPDEELPGDASDWSVENVTYEEYRTDETVVGSQEEIENAETIPFSSANWSPNDVAGEHIVDWEDVEGTRILGESEQLVWDIDEDRFMYNPSSATIVGSDQVVTQIIEQSTDPTEVSPYPNCDDASEGESCWELTNESIEIQQEFDGFYDTDDREQPYICQNRFGYYDPGPNWSLEYTNYQTGTGTINDPISERCADPDSQASYEVAWFEQKVVEEREVNEWTLQSTQDFAEVQVPDEETYYEWSRPMYDINVEWERPAQGSTEYEWEGPSVEQIERIEEPVTLRVDGSQSQQRSDVTIDEYEWSYLTHDDDETEEETTLGRAPEIEITQLGEMDLDLEVSSGELSDTDSTIIEVTNRCVGPFDCNVGQQVDLSVSEHSEVVDIRVGEIDINYEVSGNLDTDGYDGRYEIVATPGASTTTVNSDEPCISGYSRESYSTEEEYDSVEFSSQLDDPVGADVCVGSGRDAIPEEFIHPEELDSEQVTFTGSNSDAEETVWTGLGIPQEGLEGLAEINPRSNRAITTSREHETTLELRQEENPDQIYDRTTVRSIICEADVPSSDRDLEYNIVECGDLDVDLDGTPNSSDMCPYDPRFTEFPCQLEDDAPGPSPGPTPPAPDDDEVETANEEFSIRFGSQYVEQDGEIEKIHTWPEDVDNSSRDIVYGENELNTFSDRYDSEAYDPRMISIGLNQSEIENDGTLAWWTFDEASSANFSSDEVYNIPDATDGPMSTANDRMARAHMGEVGSITSDETSRGKITIEDNNSDQQISKEFEPALDNYDESNIEFLTGEFGDTSYRYVDFDDDVLEIGRFDGRVEDYTATYEQIDPNRYEQAGIAAPTGNSWRVSDEFWIEATPNHDDYTSASSGTDPELRTELTNILTGNSDNNVFNMNMMHLNQGYTGVREQAIVWTEGGSEPYVVGTTEQEQTPDRFNRENLEIQDIGTAVDEPWATAAGPQLTYEFEDPTDTPTNQDLEYVPITELETLPNGSASATVDDFEIVNYTTMSQQNITSSINHNQKPIALLRTIPVKDAPENYLASGDVPFRSSTSAWSEDPMGIESYEAQVPIQTLESTIDSEVLKIDENSYDWTHITKTVRPRETSPQARDRVEVVMDGRSTYAVEYDGTRINSGLDTEAFIHAAYDGTGIYSSFLDTRFTDNNIIYQGQGLISDVTFTTEEEAQASPNRVTDGTFETVTKEIDISDDLQDRVESGELEPDAAYFTSRNTEIKPDITWNPSSTMRDNPARITIEAIPYDAEGNMYEDESLIYNYEYDGRTSNTDQRVRESVADVTKTVSNNMDPDRKYTGFKVNAEIDSFERNSTYHPPEINTIKIAANESSVSNASTLSIDEDVSGLYTDDRIEDNTEVLIRSGDSDDDTGGRIYFVGALDHDIEDNVSVDYEFRVIGNDGNTDAVIGENSSIALRDTDGTTMDETWRSLVDEYNLPPDNSYEVEFVILEREGAWEEQTFKLPGSFYLEEGDAQPTQ